MSLHQLTGCKVFNKGLLDFYKGLLDFYHENLPNSLTYLLAWELGIEHSMCAFYPL